MNSDLNPYASPSIIPQAAGESGFTNLNISRPVAPFLSPSTHARVTQVFLVITILANLLVILLLTFTQTLLERMSAGYQPTAADIASDTMRVGTSFGILFIVRLICITCFMCWTYRVARNLPALGTLNPENSPGWAVGYYFIPILNLFCPFQAMVEIWNGSDPRQLSSGKSTTIAAYLTAWWGVHIIAGVGANMLQLQLNGQHTPDQLITHNYLVMALILMLEVPRDLLSIWLVRSVSASQEERHQLIVAGTKPQAQQANPFAFDPR